MRPDGGCGQASWSVRRLASFAACPAPALGGWLLRFCRPGRHDRASRRGGGPSVLLPVDKELVDTLYKPAQWAVTELDKINTAESEAALSNVSADLKTATATAPTRQDLGTIRLQIDEHQRRRGTKAE